MREQGIFLSQKMTRALEKLEENVAMYPEELREQERTNEELRAQCVAQSPDLSAVESIMNRELARRSTVAQGTRRALQVNNTTSIIFSLTTQDMYSE